LQILIAGGELSPLWLQASRLEVGQGLRIVSAPGKPTHYPISRAPRGGRPLASETPAKDVTDDSVGAERMKVAAALRSAVIRAGEFNCFPRFKGSLKKIVAGGKSLAIVLNSDRAGLLMLLIACRDGTRIARAPINVVPDNSNASDPGRAC